MQMLEKIIYVVVGIVAYKASTRSVPLQVELIVKIEAAIGLTISKVSLKMGWE